jgi:hypothetical protein
VISGAWANNGNPVQKYGHNNTEKYVGSENNATYNNLNIRAYHIDKVQVHDNISHR